MFLLYFLHTQTKNVPFPKAESKKRKKCNSHKNIFCFASKVGESSTLFGPKLANSINISVSGLGISTQSRFVIAIGLSDLKIG